MENFSTYKKAFAIWQPRTKTKVRVNGELTKLHTFANAVEQVKQQALQEAGKQYLSRRWQELAGQRVAPLPKAKPTFFQKVVAQVKSLLLETRLRFDYGDPNRIHPTWNRKLTRFEYLWAGLKSLSFERQTQIIPCHSDLFGKPAMSEYAISGYGNLSQIDLLSKEAYQPEVTTAKPNVEEWLKNHTVYEGDNGYYPNTEFLQAY